MTSIEGLIERFAATEFPVHESEFPLVAVIFATERDFRAHKQVDPQVQAYYEFFTNRIFFYRKSDRDQIEPKVAALLKPQTVAHEGAHQILSNIGLQPRPSAWPLWLVEGLAEYCATTVNTKKGIVWSGMGAINSLHMATLRELEDPLSNQVNGGDIHAVQVARQRAIDHPGRVADAQDRAHPHRLRPGLGPHPLPGPDARRRLRQVPQGHEPDPAACSRARPRRISPSSASSSATT